MYKVDSDELFKSHGVLWKTLESQSGPYICGETFCPTEPCRALLKQKLGAYWCVNCEKNFPCPKGYNTTEEEVERKFQGHMLRNHKVISLDLPPTKVSDSNEDEHYWVQARIGEKNGKKTAVIYFGEKKTDQKKTDYVQIFLDLEDEQVRFDKSNKNPMRLLAKLTAEFGDSITTSIKK